MKVVALFVVLALTVLGISTAQLSPPPDRHAAILQEQPATQSTTAAPSSCASQAQLASLDSMQVVPMACYTQYMCVNGAIYNSRATCTASCSGSCFIYAQCCNGRCVPY
jgi:hypothetical protein